MAKFGSRLCPLPQSRTQNKVENRLKFSNFKNKKGMRKNRYTETERMAIVGEQAKGKSVEEICRNYQISPATFYKWKQALAIQADDTKRRLYELEQENKRLKKMYAELSIDHEILQEGYDYLKKWQAIDEKKS